MREEGLLIVGIDPGVTTAYAALNIDGKLIRLKSAKSLHLSQVLHELSEAGKVIAVGTDVKHSPKFVEKFCSRLNAKLIAPAEDMKVGFKERLTKDFRCKDAHQRDALIGALHAYGEIRPLIEKVNVFLKREGKEHLSYEVMILALRGTPLRTAIELLEEEKNKESKRKRIREKIKRSSLLFEQNRRLEMENQQLKIELGKIKSSLENTSKNISTQIREKVAKTLGVKGRALSELQRSINKYKILLASQEKKIGQLKAVLMTIGDKAVVKRLKNLGWDEVKRHVVDEDAIFVDDPAMFSDNALAWIKGKVHTIIYENNLPKPIRDKAFVLISARMLDVQKLDDVVIIGKEDLEREKEKSDVLHKIIREYREEREATLQP